MVAYLFAGQGSQYVGMGKDLYESFAQSKSIFDRADKSLGFALSALCFDGPQEELTKTNNCQPAILTVSIAALEAYKAVVKPENRDAVSYAAGLSLGEYSALVAAGALSFEDAVYLVRRRGELMEEQALKRPGRMLSIIGLDLAAVKEICAKTGSEIANLNSPGQAVISGSPENLDEARKMAQEKGAKRGIFLEVSGAFHSSFMQGASEKLAAELEKISISKSSVTVVSNVTAGVVTSPLEIKNNLIKQVVSSVLWEDSMKFMLLKGITNFIEFGPGKVLKGLMRRIDENAQVINIGKKQDLVNLGEKMLLKDKVALITGGARGIGRSIALAFAKEGANIVIGDVNKEEAQKTCAEIEALGCETLALEMDVTVQVKVEEVINKILDKFTKVDILVNNAGITKDNLLLRMGEAEWDAVLNVNLKGTFNCIKAVSRPMVKQRSGKIINIASIIGLIGNPGQANYSASKAGVIALTKTAAKELASRNINVNAVAPGFIQTEMTAKLPEGLKQKMREAIALNKFGNPEDVAAVCLFLASAGSDYITGQTIVVDGGMVMV